MAQKKILDDSTSTYNQKKNLYSKSQHLDSKQIIRRYSVNVNTCFACSCSELADDLIKESTKDGKTKSDYYFERTKRMTEYSTMTGYTGSGKVCTECERECTYI